MVLRFARNLIRLKKEQPQQLEVKEPSQAFLEEDISREDFDQRLPPEVIYMLRGVRVLGFFDKPLFLQMCRQLDIINVPQGQLLFCIGDSDDSIFIVQSGKLKVFITEPDGSELMLKEVKAGDTIASLLSVLDVLNGNIAPFKTVSAKALCDSTLLRLQVDHFRKLLEKYPETFVRVIQIIMVRLQRVMFTALHNYLGLTNQLINPNHYGHKRARSGSQFVTNTQSPGRPNRISVIHQFQSSKSASDLDANDLQTMLKSMNKTEGASELGSSGEGVEVKKDDETKSHSSNVSESPIKQRSLNVFHERFKREKSSQSNDDKLQGLDNTLLQKMVIKGFMEQLAIENESCLNGRVLLVDYPAEVVLTHENTYADVSLYYILSGSLNVSLKNVDTNEKNILYIAHAGDIVGALEVITGETAAFTLTTRHSCKLGLIKKQHVYDVLAHSPKSVLSLAQTITKRLSPFVRQIDFALDWVHYESGRAIFRQGDAADYTCIVLSGRLRSVITRQNNKKELVGEYGRGDIVGIVEILTETPRSTTIMAVRDSELAKLPNGLLDVIKIKYPVVVTRLVHLLGHRLLGSLQKGNDSVSPESIGSRPTGSNFSTVAVLAISDDVPLQEFCMELNHALSAVGSSLHLTSDGLRQSLGVNALDVSNEYILSSWLGQQEDQHRIVLYQCDNTYTAWTQRCIRQADGILIVGLANQKPTVGKIEKQLDSIAVRTQKELVLLHKEDSQTPSNTVFWLNIRSWCSSHHHIRCPKRMFVNKNSSVKCQDYYSQMFEQPLNIHSDFSRLARFLTGTSIGLVLGGGGARGSAHVGMIRAIKEAGIPIDMVGGVSIGAFMGALWCQENSIQSFISKARSWSMRMTSHWQKVLDLTYPITAMFTGAAFNRSIYDVFGDKQIEDLWLPYFTVTTDISSSSPRIHRYGSLWRYVRSSMSLSGYLPPLCDPVDGHLLLDGGYVNNLPANIMRDVMGAETILAVDVGSQDETDLYNYGDTLNGWWLLWKRWNPFCEPVRVPNLPEIQSRLAYVSCVQQLEQVKNNEYCTYIRPPIDKWKTLQFGSFDEIMDVGYIHGKTLFTAVSIDPCKFIQNREVSDFENCFYFIDQSNFVFGVQF